MQLQPGVFQLRQEDYPQTVEVWEASVRATHHFVNETDIQFFKPLVREGLNDMQALVCVRDMDGRVAGFAGVLHKKVEMLFIHPLARGQGGGKMLLSYAVAKLGAVSLDVNEQNDQAVGFYLHMGWQVVGRSELDGTGKPYPLLHMRLAVSESKS